MVSRPKAVFRVVWVPPAKAGAEWEIPSVAEFVGWVEQKKLGHCLAPEGPARGVGLVGPEQVATGGEGMSLPSWGKEGIAFTRAELG